MIHRDIKPDNILLESGHATVADFGIARALSAAGADQVTQAGFVLGTPAYMSPEQALGEQVDARTDIYALGAVLHEMLGGEAPDELASAVARARARSPAERFQTAAELGQALGRAVVNPPAPSAGGCRMAVGLAALGVLLAGAALWLLFGRGDGGARPPATRLMQVTFDEAVEEYPAWSPDGRRLVFSRTVDGLPQPLPP